MFRLSPFRRNARSIAVCLLLAGPASLQHSGKDDLACVPGGASDIDGAAVGQAPAHVADHCLVCHWTRSLRSPSAAFARVHAALDVAHCLDRRPPVVHRGPALDRVPARAPPQSL